MEKWCFSDNKQESDYLFNLVKIGEKIATSYLYLNKRDIMEDKISILTNWDGTEELRLKTIRIYKCRFKDISSEHAFKEGEGDKSLSYYKSIHKSFFEKECEKIGKKFSENTEIVCEEFVVLVNSEKM